jgi:hypothetical protein
VVRCEDATTCWRFRSDEHTMASAQMNADAKNARPIPLVNAAEIEDGNCPTVPKNTAFMVAGGIEAAAPARN